MKRLFVFLVACLSLAAYAQEAPAPLPESKAMIGYLSYDSALRAMPEYVTVQQELADLRALYDAEMKRVEDDFNKKYEEFLEGQRDFPKTILTKRQTELKELMDKNIAFKEQSRHELQQAETNAYAPLHQRLRELLADIARQRAYVLIVNTDSNACPYIDPLMGEDINQVVLDALK